MAQSGAVARAAQAITAADVAQQIRILMADSMRRRVTPSPELERTATYLAAQLRQLGIPSNAVGIQRYWLPGQLELDYEKSGLVFSNLMHDVHQQAIMTEEGAPVSRSSVASFATGAHFATEVPPPAALASSEHLESAAILLRKGSVAPMSYWPRGGTRRSRSLGRMSRGE